MGRSIKLLLKYAELKDKTYEQGSERFRVLIKEARLLEGLSEEEYACLDEEALTEIAQEIIGLVNCPDSSIYDEVFNVLEQDIQNMSRDMAKSITPTIKAIHDLSVSVGKAIQPVIETIGEMAAKWSQSINETISKYKEYLTLKEQAALIATKYDWFIMYDFHAGMGFYEDLIQLDSGVDVEQSKVDKLFQEAYNNDVRKGMFEEIKDKQNMGGCSFLAEYNPIFEQIEKGFERGLYYLIVPTMFSVIEGIIAQSQYHVGQMDGRMMKVYIARLFEDDRAGSLRILIRDRMLIRFNHGDPIQSPISRNAILHGADLNYGREEVALRLFLIIYNLVVTVMLHEMKSDLQ